MVSYAFNYAKSTPLEKAEDYPLSSVPSGCKADISKEIVQISQLVAVPTKQDAQLKASLQSGPVVAMVNAGGTDFMYYSGGILNSSTCGDRVNHAVVIVGFSSDDDGDYYIVRNSWGADWGEQGYIRVAAGQDGSGVCGILTYNARPITN